MNDDTISVDDDEGLLIAVGVAAEVCPVDEPAGWLHLGRVHLVARSPHLTAAPVRCERLLVDDNVVDVVWAEMHGEPRVLAIG